jgi:phosphorylcholine metabolism protein LicD
MKPVKDMTQLEVGAFVSTHLKKHGIEVVLSGGALAALYSNNKYVSKDLDLIDIYSVDRRKLISAMKEIGFVEKNRYFIHSDSEYIVEFPPGPLTVGDEPVKKTYQVEFSTGTLTVISPTDCVKNRLAAYYHWGDKPSLTQAVLVAKETDVDIQEVKRWSHKEGKAKEFQEIESILT